mmetsp:Transcript_47622/g.101193  ORF Transcript_47622/g.101193 Transcript_47622/m.101193 type:complete len:221 (+) Transcript_47622:669-1331(+)
MGSHVRHLFLRQRPPPLHYGMYHLGALGRLEQRGWECKGVLPVDAAEAGLSAKASHAEIGGARGRLELAVEVPSEDECVQIADARTGVFSVTLGRALPFVFNPLHQIGHGVKQLVRPFRESAGVALQVDVHHGDSGRCHLRFHSAVIITVAKKTIALQSQHRGQAARTHQRLPLRLELFLLPERRHDVVARVPVLRRLLELHWQIGSFDVLLRDTVVSQL